MVLREEKDLFCFSGSDRLHRGLLEVCFYLNEKKACCVPLNCVFSEGLLFYLRLEICCLSNQCWAKGLV